MLLCSSSGKRALQNKLKSEIWKLFKEKGFDLLHIADLDEAQSELAGHASAVAIGAWDHGKWTVGGRAASLSGSTCSGFPSSWGTARAAPDVRRS